jgi:predicted nucleic acid-binding protein
VKLPEALRGIRQLAFDTAPLIYFIERHPDYFDRMLFIMRYVDQGLIAGVGAGIVLTEVLVQPIRTANQALVGQYEAVLTHSDNFRLEPVTTAVSRAAAHLRAHYNLRTPDALHIATAIDADCEAFLTNDLGLKRVTELRVLVLDELELPAAGEV